MRVIRISKTRLNQMKESILLSDLIKHTCPDLPTDKRRNKYCLCPFHTERTPSLCVNDGKQRFYCFGCGASGDHISFIFYKHFVEKFTLYQRIDLFKPPPYNRRDQKHKVFMDCVRILSQITGISIKGK